MKIIYVAGPFRGPTAWDIAENIRAAERIGLLVANAAAMPLIPHANTAHFDGQRTGDFWIQGTLELLRRCDGAIFLPNWKGSVGSRGEWDECEGLKLPHMSLEHVDPGNYALAICDFVAWLKGKDDGQVDHSEEQRKAGQTVANGARQDT